MQFIGYCAVTSLITYSKWLCRVLSISTCDTFKTNFIFLEFRTQLFIFTKKIFCLINIYTKICVNLYLERNNICFNSAVRYLFFRKKILKRFLKKIYCYGRKQILSISSFNLEKSKVWVTHPLCLSCVRSWNFH